MRTLIADDEADMRLLMRMTLALDAGIDVAAEASSGNEAIELWDALRPDVVILDMRMPGMTGLEAARAILARAPGQPIIMCSAYMDVDARIEAELLGAEFVDKIDMDKLAQVVTRAGAA